MEEMIMMSGMSVSEIAEEVGMTRQAIDRHVPEHMRGRAPTFSTRFYEACLENLEKGRAARNTKTHEWNGFGQYVNHRRKRS
jgi:predicted transcriptional regulator